MRLNPCELENFTSLCKVHVLRLPVLFSNGPSPLKLADAIGLAYNVVSENNWRDMTVRDWS
jgi:hypothetical protein